MKLTKIERKNQLLKMAEKLDRKYTRLIERAINGERISGYYSFVPISDISDIMKLVKLVYTRNYNNAFLFFENLDTDVQEELPYMFVNLLEKVYNEED